MPFLYQLTLYMYIIESRIHALTVLVHHYLSLIHQRLCSHVILYMVHVHVCNCLLVLPRVMYIYLLGDIVIKPTCIDCLSYVDNE